MNASNCAEFVELNENATVLTLLDSAGFVGQQLNNGNAHVAVQQILMHQVLHKRRCEMDEISRGMEELSLPKLLHVCPDLVSVVFPTSASQAIDPSLLKSMLRVDPNHYIGNAECEAALKWLKIYIDECGEGIQTSICLLSQQNLFICIHS